MIIEALFKQQYYVDEDYLSSTGLTLDEVAEAIEDNDIGILIDEEVLSTKTEDGDPEIVAVGLVEL